MCVCVDARASVSTPSVCVHLTVHEVRKLVPGPWGKGQLQERSYEGGRGGETTLMSIKGKQPLQYISCLRARGC